MLNKEFETLRHLLDEELEQAVSTVLIHPENPIKEPMKYGLTTGGKRIRGTLTIVFCDRLGVPRSQSVPFAVALEMIHAYSLVHDDMPEMDDDDYRRGMPSCHKKYGSAMALLAGDAILNGAMEYLLHFREQYEPACFLNALTVLFNAAGANGMLCGQVLDMIGETKLLNLEELCELHRLKTGALLLAPSQIAGALSKQDASHYHSYCMHIGLAFQIKDDLLDVEGDPAVLGKEIGKDQQEHKSTFVTLLGCEQAKAYLQKEVESALNYAGDDPFLTWLANYIETRAN